MIGLLVLGLLVSGDSSAREARGGTRRVEPSQVLPLDQVAPQHRESVAEIVRDHTFHRKGPRIVPMQLADLPQPAQ
ncbi:MAG: hypothetical protein WKF75_14860 [Singulisphaera sp.]